MHLQVHFKPVSNLYKWFVGKSVSGRSSAGAEAAATSTTAGGGLERQGSANNFTSALLSSIGLGTGSTTTVATDTRRTDAASLKSSVSSSAPPSLSSSPVPPTREVSTPSLVEPLHSTAAAPAHDEAQPLHRAESFSTIPEAAKKHEKVEVRVNGQVIPALEMKMDEKGFCVFVATGTAQPPPEILSSLPLHDGPNPIEFIYR